MDFETAYGKWMDRHLAERKGERLRKLREDHGFGEKLLLQEVWWPVVGSLDMLYPEYEVVDEDGNRCFIDHAYVRGPRPMAIEADGFGSHARDIDRNDFTRSRRRQNGIVLGDWIILRFSIDDIKEDPEACRRTLRRALERFYGSDRVEWLLLPLHKREIMRLAIREMRPINASDVCQALGSGAGLARKLLRELCKEGYLEPEKDALRVHHYRIKPMRPAIPPQSVVRRKAGNR